MPGGSALIGHHATRPLAWLLREHGTRNSEPFIGRVDPGRRNPSRSPAASARLIAYAHCIEDAIEPASAFAHRLNGWSTVSHG
jgi:hypothetical protein